MSSYQQQEWPAPAVGSAADAEQSQLLHDGAAPQRVSEWRWPPARRLCQFGLMACAALLMLALAMPTEDKAAAPVAPVVPAAPATAPLHPATTVDTASRKDGHKNKDNHKRHSEKSKDKQHERSSSAPPPGHRGKDSNAVSAAGMGGARAGANSSIINSQEGCAGPFPGYPYCQDHVTWMTNNWNINPEQEAFYRSKGVDGTQCSFLNYLNLNGFFCPEAADASKRTKIRGVNLGGWLVLEPWIAPSLFEQFDVKKQIMDHWMFCEELGQKECRSQLEKHWDTFLLESDLEFLSQNGINHVRIPVGYWLFGDIRSGEPWVNGELPYLERAIRWCQKYGLHAVLDLHAAPGSQNGFDNSGRKGEVHFDHEEKSAGGRVIYPNIRRALEVIANLTAHFSTPEFSGTVVGIELVNEAFVTIPIEVVKDYYLQGYEIVKQHGDTMAVIIGDSFRFGAWNDFMFPPHYRHVWIDTHIYQMFDISRLSMTWQQHLHQTCTLNKPEVAVAPLSTMVGEWSLATTDCAKWLNGYDSGSRFDGTFPGAGAPVLGSCIGQNDITNKTIWTPEYKNFLSEYTQKQMDAYESGSSQGWFFWNFKTEKGAPQWNYMLGVKEGWIPSNLDNRPIKC